MKKLLGGLLSCILGGWLLTACTSDDDLQQIPEGKGYVKLALNTNTGFQTKAVDESYYSKKENYTVTITKSGESVPVQQWKYNEIPEFTELANGTYTMSAICGDSTKAVYTNDLCVLGYKSFTVKNDSVNVEVACKPNSARINIVFDEKMDEYFSDYEVRIKTAAQSGSTYIWEKETTGPVYFKVKQSGESVAMTIKLTPKSGVSAETSIEKTCPLSPADAMKMTLTPVVGSGKLSLTITIDETVIEHPVDIEVPSDWV